MKKKTKEDIFYNFELFGRNLRKIDDKYELIFKCYNINKTNSETVHIFPLVENFTTNHVIFRVGNSKLLLCAFMEPPMITMKILSQWNKQELMYFWLKSEKK